MWWSANAFNLDQSKILLFGKELSIFTKQTLTNYHTKPQILSVNPLPHNAAF